MIIEEEDYNGGEPSLPSGYTVSQVVQLTHDRYEGSFNPIEAAERLEVPLEEIESALEYYEDERQKIDSILEEKEKIAREFSLRGEMEKD